MMHCPSCLRTEKYSVHKLVPERAKPTARIIFGPHSPAFSPDRILFGPHCPGPRWTEYYSVQKLGAARALETSERGPNKWGCWTESAPAPDQPTRPHERKINAKTGPRESGPNPDRLIFGPETFALLEALAAKIMWGRNLGGRTE